MITDARVGLAAVGPNTTGIPAISEALRGRPPCEDALRRGRRDRGRHCSPVTDQRGSAAYKRHLADELTRRALRRAVARVVGRSPEPRAGTPAGVRTDAGRSRCR